MKDWVASRSETEDTKCIAATGSAVTGRRSDVPTSHQPQQAHGEVAQGGHHAGAIPAAVLGAVLILGSVPDMMAAILDLPMATSQRQQLFWIGFRGGQACETIGHPIVDLVVFHVHGNTLDEKSLAEMGKVDACRLGGNGDFTDFEPAMPDVGGFSAEGEKIFPGEAGQTVVEGSLIAFHDGEEVMRFFSSTRKRAVSHCISNPSAVRTLPWAYRS